MKKTKKTVKSTYLSTSMHIRKKIMDILRKLEKYLPGEYLNIYKTDLQRIYNSVPSQTNAKVTPNIMHDIYKFKPSKNISEDLLFNINKQLHELVLQNSKTSGFTKN